MKNEQAQMTGLGTIEISPCEMPRAGEGEVVVKPLYVGICGSDVHFFQYGKIGKKVIDRPFVLGHECSAAVVETGPGVRGLHVGDRVAIEPGVPCGQCWYCRNGKYNLCPDMQFISSPPYDGCFRRYLRYPERMIHKLTDNISDIGGAMIEPLAVGLHAAKTGRVALGKNVVILGAGPIGIMAMLACRAMGAAKIFITDLIDSRLRRARGLGADYALNPQECDVPGIVLEETDGMGAQAVLETAGNPKTVQQAGALAARGGHIVLVGNVTEPVELDLMGLMVKEADIRPIYRYRNMFPIAIKALDSGQISREGVDPGIFEFEQIQEAFDYTVNHAEQVMKTLVKIGA
ncbi:MAG: putative zinc-type alcohol dehydrogenase-like protein YdjJ [Desulfovibrio sp.]